MSKIKKTTKKNIENKAKSKKDITENKNIQNVLNDINKKFGKNSARLGGEILKKQPMIRIPTGNVSLDIDLGGGIPIGRYTEISGAFSSTKTTQCVHIMKNAINMNLVPAFLDAEGTSGDELGQPDELYFNNIGVDINNFIYSRPDSLEEATEMILDFQKSGEVHVAILDSLAMLEPNKVLDSKMEENVQMGIKPKLLNEFFNKFQLNNNKLVREGKRPFTLICTNQLREKIGVMYGCLHADTNICLVDGRSYAIRDIVENKIEGEVYSYNEKTKIIETKKIIDWHYNGDVKSKKDYIYIRTHCPDNKNDTSAITVTPDHKVLTDKGWMKAKDITISNKLVTKSKNRHGDFNLTNKSELIPEYVPVLEIRECSNKQFMQRGKYDISIEDNHNYIAGGKYNGVIVHNSPEYSPGGRGKGFTSSVDIRLRQGDLITENKQVVGQVVKYKINKNKTYMRLKSGEFDMYLDDNEAGIPKMHSDNIKSVIVQAVSWGVIERGGAWFYLDKEKKEKFQGLDSLIVHIKENPNLIDKLKREVLKRASKVK